MLKFNTRDKKPKIWNVAVLAAVTCIAVVIMANREPVNLKAVVTTICIAYALAIIFLVNALIKQIQYNPYSYNTIYYMGFALFLFAVFVRTYKPYHNVRTEKSIKVFRLYQFPFNSRR